MTQPEKLQLKNKTKQILNVPGNYKGGILEMTMVFDTSLDPSFLKQESSDIVTTLKSSNKIFRNVRLNTVTWNNDEDISTAVSSLAFLLLGRLFEAKAYITPSNQEKSLDALLYHLKLFHARSKLILVLTRQTYKILSRDSCKESLSPFVKQKLLLLNEEKIFSGNQLFFSLIEK